MAHIRKSKNKALFNALVAGFSGSLGGLTIKQYKDKIVLTTKAAPKRWKKPTAGQADKRSLFQEAVFYAQQVKRDPKRAAAYARKLKGKRNVFQAAVSAYLRTGGKGVI